MLISTESIKTLAEKVRTSQESFCTGLFLSARWFAVSQLDHEGLQMIVLPDKDSAEYCAADLYNLIEGDRIFFLPDSGKTLERSNYKSTLGVQRTSAIGKIMEYDGNQLMIVTYPAALEEGIPDQGSIRESVLHLSTGDEISHDIKQGGEAMWWWRSCMVKVTWLKEGEVGVGRVLGVWRSVEGVCAHVPKVC